MGKGARQTHPPCLISPPGGGCRPTLRLLTLPAMNIAIDLDAVSYSGIAAQDKYVMVGTGYNRWDGKGSFYVFKLK